MQIITIGKIGEHRAAWVRWDFDWEAKPGNYTIRVRATDEKGNTQPDLLREPIEIYLRLDRISNNGSFFSEK